MQFEWNMWNVVTCNIKSILTNQRPGSGHLSPHLSIQSAVRSSHIKFPACYEPTTINSVVIV